jgi:hypothetical protein
MPGHPMIIAPGSLEAARGLCQTVIVTNTKPYTTLITNN